ncbi:hypothetical protein [Cohnella soli]|uniref:Uncharacterized protein n=1 Tax=Cohnella soli TaxID=425005 RepID=A0ABW0HRB1_9BACL
MANPQGARNEMGRGASSGRNNDKGLKMNKMIKYPPSMNGINKNLP